METIYLLFGDGESLNTLQMMLRAVIIFFIALALVRIAGRRTFGMRAPLDNIIVFLFGAVLGRAVVGASPFIPTVCACLAISIIHRLLAWLSVQHPWVGKFVKGRKISLLTEDGALSKKNMKRSLASREDIMEEIRLRIHTDSLDDVEKLYMERSGEISAIKKPKVD